MIYVDTGCLLQLYFPEAESVRIAKLVSGKPIVFSLLHELELSNALELKVFRKEAKPTQTKLTHELIESDVRAGILYRPNLVWEDVFKQATLMAKAHTRALGCRSLDILHCAAARSLAASSFVTTDVRQRKLALSAGLACPSV